MANAGINGKWAPIEDISAQVAELIHFLVSDAASHITGAEVFIEGRSRSSKPESLAAQVGAERLQSARVGRGSAWKSAPLGSRRIPYHSVRSHIIYVSMIVLRSDVTVGHVVCESLDATRSASA